MNEGQEVAGRRFLSIALPLWRRRPDLNRDDAFTLGGYVDALDASEKQPGFEPRNLLSPVWRRSRHTFRYDAKPR